jgi:hypothetical protein
MKDFMTVSDFSVGFDNEVEDVSLYFPNQDTPKEFKDFLDILIHDKKIIVGERCEGSISIKEVTRFDQVCVEYRWCESLGENEWDDIWNDEVLMLNRDHYDI